MPHAHPTLNIDLSAVIVAVSAGQPHVMLVPSNALPTGPFNSAHRTLEQGLRDWVRAQSGLQLGYVEQLYTFADRDRAADTKQARDHRVVSIGYLALTRDAAPQRDAAWSSWYLHFPWEDYREGGNQPVLKNIWAGLQKWKNAAPDASTKRARDQRIAVTFPRDKREWNEELVLQRYELLWEAGLIEEAARDRGEKSSASIKSLAMAHDHRRILATAMARLRAKIKYRPVVFELLPDQFTLLHLQSTVEALAGLRLHKQNFRRLVQGQGLVEETDVRQQTTGGRPAKLFAFRREVLRERAAAGTKLPRS